MSCRPARSHQPSSHQHFGAGALGCRPCLSLGSTSKRAVDVLWSELPGPLSAHRRTCRQILRGASRPNPGRTADQIRSCRQSDTAKALGLDRSADAARPRRRGDRVRAPRVHHAARRRGGGVAAAARAQQGDGCGASACSAYGRGRSGSQARIAAFVQGLQQLGWTVGRNVQIDYRWGVDDAERSAKTRRNWSHSRRTSSWLVTSTVAPCNRRPAPCRSCSRKASIRSAPASSTSMARPGGNITGFISFEYGLGAKWLELLKEIAPKFRAWGSCGIPVSRGSDSGP